MFTLEKRRLRGDLIVAFQYVKVSYKKDGESLVTKAYRGRAKNNGFRLDKMKTFFMMRVVRCWLSTEISQRNDRFLWDTLPREL